MAAKLDDRSRAGARNTGDTLPPTPLAVLAAAGGADLLVLSADSQLLDTVTRVSGAQLPVWPVASWKELETALAVARRAVVLVDAELLGDATRARIAALGAYSHKVVALLAADRQRAEGLMGLLSEGKVHRLLIKPAAPGITRLLIDSAVGRCLKLADAPEPEPEPGPAKPPPSVAEPARPPPVERREPAAVPFSVFAAAGAALVAGVAVIATVSAWWRSSPLDQPPLAVEAQAPEVAAMALEPDAARREGPGSDEGAKDDLGGDPAILAAGPATAAAPRLDAGVAASAPTEPPRATVPSSERELAAARAAQRHGEWLARAEARLRVGALLEPADDSARHYLQLLQNEAPDHAGLAASWLAFTGALRERISAAIEAHDWTKAEEGLAALAAAPNGAEAAAPLRAQLTTAKLAESYLATAAPASELAVLEHQAPVYPVDAARAGVEGWVEVEFVVDETGRPRDFAVVAAEPKGRFEEAALAALTEYRYRPFVQDGRAFARRVKLRVRFALR